MSTMTLTEIRDATSKLSPDDRRALINAMLEDVLEPALPLPADELSELQRISGYADAHPESCTPAAEVIAQMRARFGK